MREKIIEILNEYKAPYDSDGVYVNAINEDDFPAIAEKIEALDNWVSVETPPEEEHETEVAYWAGRLNGYDQAWEVAAEIVDTIKKLRKSTADTCKKCGEPLYFAMGSLFCPNPKC